MTIPRDHRGSSRRSVLAGAFAALGWSAFDRAEAAAQERAGGSAPVAARDANQGHQAGDLHGQAALAVPQGPHRRRDRRPGRADRRGAGRDRGDGGQGDRALPDGQGPATGRAPLAGDLPARVLPRRADPDQRPQRHRHGALGHQGQGAGRARLRAAGRPDAGPGPRLCARGHARADQAGRGAGLHGVQDQPGEAPAAAVRRDAGRGALRRREVRRAAEGRRRRRRHRHRLPRRHQPGDRQAADQGARAAISRCSSRSPARRRTTT